MSVCLVLLKGFPLLAYAQFRTQFGAGLDLRSATGRAVAADDGTLVPPGRTDWAGASKMTMVALLAGSDWSGQLSLGLRRLLVEADRAGATLAGIGHGADLLARLGHIPSARLSTPGAVLDAGRLTIGHTALSDLPDALAQWRRPEKAALPPSPPLHQDPVMLRAETILRADLSQTMTLPELAQRLTLSPKQFRLRCQSVTGLPPGAWIRQIRLEEARALVTATRLPVQEIAEATGFGNLSAFIRAYRMRYGAAPRQSRKGQACTRV